MTPRSGSGNRVSLNLSLGEFTRLRLATFAKVYIYVGQPQSVALEIDDNLMDLISTEVVAGTLLIDKLEEYSSLGGLVAKVSVPEFDYLSVAGMGNIEIFNLSSELLTINIYGKATLKAAGQVTEEIVNIDGVGADIDLFDTKATRGTIAVNGVGNAKVTTTESLTVFINGVGRIRYKGNPGIINERINGIGHVMPA
jgi:Putative auto-transporter adhesin, head GIN domain